MKIPDISVDNVPARKGTGGSAAEAPERDMAGVFIIEIEELSHVYMRDTPFETKAINGVSLKIRNNEILSVVGPTGCGKSTLIQHLNGILKPSSGKVIVDGCDIWERGADLRKIRQKVGLVFQYPEHQLFEETVFDDVAFGPRNLGMAEGEVQESVKASLLFLDLPFDRIKERSPFSLSGGEMRRVALAGVLAMKPRVLVLDEPTAGLDPMGRRKLQNKIRELQKEQGTTIVLVSHAVEEIAEISDRIVVMKEGGILLEGEPGEVFSRHEELKSANLLLPQYTQLMRLLKEKGMDVRDDIYTLNAAKDEILSRYP
jgi:energy-coupling factor transport system ATP-binding protein